MIRVKVQVHISKGVFMATYNGSKKTI